MRALLPKPRRRAAAVLVLAPLLAGHAAATDYKVGSLDAGGEGMKMQGPGGMMQMHKP